VVAVKVHCVFFAAALSTRSVMVAGERRKHVNLQTQCCGDERLPERLVKGVVGAHGPDGLEPRERFLEYVAGLGVVGLLLQSVHLNAKSGFRDRGLVLLGEMELALLHKTHASVAQTQDLELGPVLAELLRETARRRNWAGPESTGPPTRPSESDAR
jgi:hypothetical protein